MKQKMGKRIVSKSEYFRLQGKRSRLWVSGTTLLLLSASCGVCTLVCFIGVVWSCVKDNPPAGMFDVFMICLFLLACFAVAAYLLGRKGNNLIDRAAEIDVGVPLNRANTANLPAPDILVRASFEPRHEQEAILLRAAVKGQHTPPEHLVRPARAE